MRGNQALGFALLLAGSVILAGCGGGGGGGGGGGTVDDPPAVTNITPADRAVNVRVDQSVTVAFSEAVVPGTVTGGSVSLRESGSSIVLDATVVYDGATHTATLDPLYQLASDTAYILTVSSTITDLTGNAMEADVTCSFSTGADTVGPSVVYAYPAPGGEGAIYPTVTVFFDEPLYEGLLDATSLTLYAGSTPVDGSWFYIAGDWALGFEPTDPLALDAAYNIRVSAAVVEDGVGNPMGTDIAWSFTTAVPAVTGQPVAVPGVVPAGGALTVSFPGNGAAFFAEVYWQSAADSGLMGSGFVDADGAFSIGCSAPGISGDYVVSVIVYDEGFYFYGVDPVVHGYGSVLQYMGSISTDHYTYWDSVNDPIIDVDSGIPLTWFTVY